MNSSTSDKVLEKLPQENHISKQPTLSESSLCASKKLDFVENNAFSLSHTEISNTFHASFVDPCEDTSSKHLTHSELLSSFLPKTSSALKSVQKNKLKNYSYVASSTDNSFNPISSSGLVSNYTSLSDDSDFASDKSLYPLANNLVNNFIDNHPKQNILNIVPKPNISNDPSFSPVILSTPGSASSSSSVGSDSESSKIKDDDGNELFYLNRVHEWRASRFKLRYKLDHPDQFPANLNFDSDSNISLDSENILIEDYLPDPATLDHITDVDDQITEILEDQLLFLKNKILTHQSNSISPPLLTPHSIWSNLLPYQKTGLQWLWKLHNMNIGGILGDEMGLGKTIQIVAFISSLYHSKLLVDKNGKQLPTLIVCPATLMRQWLQEFNKWWPPLKTVILHSSGSGIRLFKSSDEDSCSESSLAFNQPTSFRHNSNSFLKNLKPDLVPIYKASKLVSHNKLYTNHSISYKNQNLSSNKLQNYIDYSSEFDSDEFWDHDNYGWRTQKKKSYKKLKNISNKLKKDPQKNRLGKRSEKIINRIVDSGAILITTYAALASNKGSLLNVNWGYAVLDEGHIIKNSVTDVSLMAKRLLTKHRILVTGTPIQNNLQELWTLFDFVNPNLLGDQQNFTRHSSNVQVVYKRMLELRHLISPYLLRREKKTVFEDDDVLNSKFTELVVICSLSLEQSELYKRFSNSSQLESIYQGKLNPLFGIDYVRKIANHPKLLTLQKKKLGFDDLYDKLPATTNKTDGDESCSECCKLISKSGKLAVFTSMLDTWDKKVDKVLLFTQTRQMLDIIEKSLKHNKNCKKYDKNNKIKYLRMDGTTRVQLRSQLVKEFNDPTKEIFIFLLTTRVGGLGLNLTAANKVVIFDPDWNPSTDNQAKQRCVRIGQKRHVSIYRLITKDTIETNIYYKQLYKQLLSLNVLKNNGKYLKNKFSFFSQSVRDLFNFDSSLYENLGSSIKDTKLSNTDNNNNNTLIEKISPISNHGDFDTTESDNQIKYVNNNDKEAESHFNIETKNPISRANNDSDNEIRKSGLNLIEIDKNRDTNTVNENGLDILNLSSAVAVEKYIPPYTKLKSTVYEKNTKSISRDEIQDNSLKYNKKIDHLKDSADKLKNEEEQSNKKESEEQKDEVDENAEIIIAGSKDNEDSILGGLLKIANIHKTLHQDSLLSGDEVGDDENFETEGQLSVYDDIQNDNRQSYHQHNINQKNTGNILKNEIDRAKSGEGINYLDQKHYNDRSGSRMKKNNLNIDNRNVNSKDQNFFDGNQFTSLGANAGEIGARVGAKSILTNLRKLKQSKATEIKVNFAEDYKDITKNLHSGFENTIRSPPSNYKIPSLSLKGQTERPYSRKEEFFENKAKNSSGIGKRKWADEANRGKRVGLMSTSKTKIGIKSNKRFANHEKESNISLNSQMQKIRDYMIKLEGSTASQAELIQKFCETPENILECSKFVKSLEMIATKRKIKVNVGAKIASNKKPISESKITNKTAIKQDGEQNDLYVNSSNTVSFHNPTVNLNTAKQSNNVALALDKRANFGALKKSTGILSERNQMEKVVWVLMDQLKKND
ncbi:hypothetical protein BB561_001256 [Smittium simulii]|uniref:DNA repair and recombination protein RAD26 n=1 Tax=Smittium simulii TaxID=133385 RepID=A0A2T9YVE1_9FUNG|nr:hypothetical protein BB561_001256 [Smittium simulii]